MDHFKKVLSSKNSKVLLGVFTAVMLLLAYSLVFIYTSDGKGKDISVSGANYVMKVEVTSPSNTASMNIGDTLTMNIVADLPTTDNSNPNVAEIIINFDPGVLNGVSITESSGLLALNKNVDNLAGKMTIDVAKGGSNFVGSTTLATIAFTVKQKVQSTTVSINTSSTLGYPNTLDITSPLLNKQIALLSAICGNGIKEESETCDATSRSCTLNGYLGTETCNTSCNGYNTCIPTERCGDAIKNGSEECDDGNANNTDSCSNTCTVVTTNPPPSPVCGDGKVEGNEVCDGGSQSCTKNGYTGSKTCKADCTGYSTCTTTLSCGDGIQNGTEACDDGNSNNSDTCSNSCTINSVTPTLNPAPTTSQTQTPVCGNGNIETGETCDDGNTSNSDQCSSDCQNSCAANQAWDGSICATITAETTTNSDNNSGQNSTGSNTDYSDGSVGFIEEEDNLDGDDDISKPPTIVPTNVSQTGVANNDSKLQLVLFIVLASGLLSMILLIKLIFTKNDKDKELNTMGELQTYAGMMQPASFAAKQNFQGYRQDFTQTNNTYPNPDNSTQNTGNNSGYLPPLPPMQ